MALFHEGATAYGTNVLTDGHVGAHVTRQLTAFGCRVFAAGYLATEDIAWGQRKQGEIILDTWNYMLKYFMKT